MLSRRTLLVLAIGVPLLEAVALIALGLDADLGLAPQASALGPFGVFHDLRWLFVFHESVAGFAAGLVVVVLGRALLLAALVGAAWPGTDGPPPLVTLLRRAIVATAVASLLLWPWVTLLYGTALLPVSWAFMAAVPAALLTMLLIHHGGIDGSWLARLPSLRSMGWIVLSFVSLSAAALATEGRSAGVTLVIVAAAGLFNARAWVGCVAATTVRGRSPRSGRFPATVAAVAAMLAVVVGGAWIGFEAADDGGTPTPADADSGSRAVLVVAGFASECCAEGGGFRALADDLLVEQFSYLGLDGRGLPLPHAGDATNADLDVLADLLAAQVEALYARTGLPVAIVAESEGTLVVTAFLDGPGSRRVDRLVLLSPIVAPGRVVFPEVGGSGRGVVAGSQLRALTAVIAGIAPIPLAVDGPLGESVRREAVALNRGSMRDRPGIEELAVVPLADALTGPPGVDYEVPVVYVAGFHGGLRGRPDVESMIVDWLHGGEPQGSDTLALAARLISGSAAAWQMPLGGSPTTDQVPGQAWVEPAPSW